MESPSSPSFTQRLRAVWDRGIAIHVVVEKAGSRIVDLPLTIVIIGAVLAPWALAIGLVVAVVLGYAVRIVQPPAEPAPEPAPEPPAEAELEGTQSPGDIPPA